MTRLTDIPRVAADNRPEVAFAEAPHVYTTTWAHMPKKRKRSAVPLALGMIAALVAVAVAGHHVMAETVTAKAGRVYGDQMSLSMESAAAGVLTYHNSGSQVSVSGTWPITSGPVNCAAFVTIGNAEHVAVTCESPYAADPARADIPDGEAFDFIVTLQGF
jgi:hypothetical protein